MRTALLERLAWMDRERKRRAHREAMLRQQRDADIVNRAWSRIQAL